MRTWGLFANPILDSALPLVTWPWAKFMCFLQGHMATIQTNSTEWCVRCGQETKYVAIR